MRAAYLFFVLILSFTVFAQTPSSVGKGGPPQKPEKLLQELACGNCHSGVKTSKELFQEAPSLSFAGLRYTAGYLFQYLEKPARVRGHIGASRMPQFQLDTKERLALTLYLIDQQEQESTLLTIPQALTGKVRAVNGEEMRKLIVEELRCTSCHKFRGEGDDRAVELMNIGWRLKSEWFTRYLAYPQAFEAHSSMPAFFYTRSEDKQQLVETIPDAGEKLLALVAYLDSAGRKQRTLLERELEEVQSANPSITADLGEKIFVALNCTACHTHHTIKAWQNAPDLSIEGKQVKKDWLATYLTKPQPIRPFGFYPGTGSRMPDFKLSSEEAALLSDYLSGSRNSGAKPTLKPRKMSPFAASKAEKMIREKLPCLGCHTLDKEGGKIGPDLSHATSRLQPEFVVEMIREPMKAVPNTVMPKMLMDDGERELLVNYLLQREASPSKALYLGLTETPLYQPADTSSTEGLYRRYCASCHGESGNGDGFNAKFLPVQPAAHASKEIMSTRADDTLFDGIHSGGTILNKNHRMPAFGETLSREQIWALVRYIRELCKCEGPVWSRK